MCLDEIQSRLRNAHARGSFPNQHEVAKDKKKLGGLGWLNKQFHSYVME